ncbi:hypothetical protein D3C85_1671610 [compost metagenome]
MGIARFASVLRAAGDPFAAAAEQTESGNVEDAAVEPFGVQAQGAEATGVWAELAMQAQAVVLKPGVLLLQVLRGEEGTLTPEDLSVRHHILPAYRVSG